MIPLHVPPLELREALAFPQGDYVRKLKDFFRTNFHKQDALFTSDGRNAIYLALKMLKIEKTDEVLMPGYACYAAREPIRRVCVPIYVDIDRQSFNIDPEQIEKKITRNTKAILVVHLYGNPCPMDAILGLASKHNLAIIEDVAQALGGKYKNRLLGSFGHFAVFSFRSTKDITAFRGGALLANRELVWEAKAPSLFWAGAGVFLSLLALKQINILPALIYAPLRKRILVPFFSRNSLKLDITQETLSNYQCYLLYKQLSRLGAIIAKRRQHAAYYSQQLHGIVVTPQETPGGEHTFLRYTIQTDRRDELCDHLLRHGIETGKMYDYSLAPADSCPNSVAVSRTILNIPVHQELTDNHLKRIVATIRTGVAPGEG